MGSAELPAPTSAAWAAQTSAIVGGSSAANIGVWIVLVSIAAGLTLESRKVSASSIAMGILLPISSVVPMVLGCLCKAALDKREYRYTTCVTGGLILGDGLLGFIKPLI
jgi:uncharacterized oligopeptide transporter (OPT) family protein